MNDPLALVTFALGCGVGSIVGGWFRPKLMVHTFTDPPGEEIPQDSIYPVPEVRPPHVTPTQVRQPGGRS